MQCKTVLLLLGRNISVIDFADPWKQYDTTVSKHSMYKQLSTNATAKYTTGTYIHTHTHTHTHTDKYADTPSIIQTWQKKDTP